MPKITKKSLSTNFSINLKNLLYGVWKFGAEFEILRLKKVLAPSFFFLKSSEPHIQTHTHKPTGPQLLRFEEHLEIV